MVAKTRIIDALGESALLLPESIGRALDANDRVKYCFALLQGAKQHADHPQAPCADLHVEREASGIDDESLDEVIAGSRREHDGSYHVPQAAHVLQLVWQGIEAMLAPLELTAAGAGEARRFETLRALVGVDDDRLPAGFFDAVTHAERERGDSLHLLVMDLHRQLNALQVSLARESIDGAQAFAIGEADRPRIRAFMRGLNATAPLKFDHPGLGTTAMRSGDALVLQNDIGTTDAHVLVVRVRGTVASLTYTDIHERRAAFFMSLFERASVAWDDTRSQQAAGLAEGGRFILCSGRFEGADEVALDRYLEFLGSRIVFLIDWNKARKRLRQFMRQRDAIDVLKWAADHNHGHRGFLELGGERLIIETLKAAGTMPADYGERLDRVLGREAVIEHMKYVLATAAGGLREKRSARLIRDEIRADLLERLHTAEEGFYALLADHATIAAELAGALCDGLADAPAASPDGKRLRVIAERAKHWETQADGLVMRVRESVKHCNDRATLERLAHDADDIVDQLEEAAFLLPLLPAVGTPAPLYAPLAALAAIVLDGARALVRCLDAAPHVQRGGAREDLHDFLEAVDRMVTVEHETDEADRGVTLTLVSENAEHRQLHLLSLLGKRLEKAADAMSRCALALRDRVMAQVMQG